MKKIFFIIVLISIFISFYYFSYLQKESKNLEGFTFGNGRSQTTQVDISSKLSGRLETITVQEGDLVEKNQLLAKIEIKELNTKLQEALAHKNQAIENKKYALQIVNQKQSELSLVEKDFYRANNLFKSKSISLAEFQKRENGLRTKEQERNESKYRFFKAIFSSSRCEIYFKENGVDSKISPFLKEIIEHYNIEIKTHQNLSHGLLNNYTYQE